MTIKEALKKVESYNELAEILRNRKIVLEFGYDTHFSETFYSYKQFRAWLKKEIITEIATEILDFDNFEFGKEFNFTYQDPIFPALVSTTVEINIYETNFSVY